MKTTTSTTQTIEAPGATITYDINRNPENSDPVLLLIGHPMGAAGFTTLAGLFPERSIATYDPRGVERSEKDDPTMPSSPEVHADDLHRLIEAIDAGPVDLFASSGGAINALALVARHPEQVRTVVAHEPPLVSLLPDRDEAEALVRAIHDTYQRDGWGAGMAHFIVAVSHRGPVTKEVAAQAAPDPGMFQLPTEDDGNRTDPMLSQTLISMTHYQPDFAALAAASTRIVIAAGKASDGEIAHRGALAVAARLGQEVVSFPSDHGGFLGGEYGQTGDPAAFAATLRQVLDKSSL